MSGLNERLWWTLDTGNMFGPTVGFKIHTNFNLKNKMIKICTILMIFYLPTWGSSAPPYTSPNLAQNLLSDQL